MVQRTHRVTAAAAAAAAAAATQRPRGQRDPAAQRPSGAAAQWRKGPVAQRPSGAAVQQRKESGGTVARRCSYATGSRQVAVMHGGGGALRKH